MYLRLLVGSLSPNTISMASLRLGSLVLASATSKSIKDRKTIKIIALSGLILDILLGLLDEN